MKFKTVVGSKRRITLPKEFEQGTEVWIIVKAIAHSYQSLDEAAIEYKGEDLVDGQFAVCRVCGGEVDTHSEGAIYRLEGSKRMWAHIFCL